MKTKDLERYTPEQIKALCIQYWQGRKKVEKRVQELEGQLAHQKLAVEQYQAVIAQAREILE